MKQIFRKGQFRMLLPYFLFALGLIGAYKLMNEFSFFIAFLQNFWDIILPFFYGFLLAYILSLPCNFLQKLFAKSRNRFVQKYKKALAIVLVYLLSLLALYLVLNLIIPAVYKSVSLFADNFQTYYRRAKDFVQYINDFNLLGLEISMDKILNEIIALVQGFSVEDLSASLNALFAVSSSVFDGFLTFISSIYVLSEKEKFKAFFCRLVKAFAPDQVYRTLLTYTRKLDHNFKQYIYTQSIDGLILAIAVSIELYFMGSSYALVLGILLGLANYIPYFGAIIGTVVIVIIVAFTQGIPAALLALIVLLVTQQIDGNIIQPKLMGGSFDISPLLIIVSITIGGAIAGPLGMIAAIPIVSVLKDILEDVIVYYEERKKTASDIQ